MDITETAAKATLKDSHAHRPLPQRHRQAAQPQLGQIPKETFMKFKNWVQIDGYVDSDMKTQELKSGKTLRWFLLLCSNEGRSGHVFEDRFKVVLYDQAEIPSVELHEGDLVRISGALHSYYSPKDEALQFQIRAQKVKLWGPEYQPLRNPANQ